MNDALFQTTIGLIIWGGVIVYMMFKNQRKKWRKKK